MYKHLLLHFVYKYIIYIIISVYYLCTSISSLLKHCVCVFKYYKCFTNNINSLSIYNKLVLINLSRQQN